MQTLLDLVPRRTLIGSLTLAVGLPALVLAGWMGPWSPGALARADRMAEQGEWSQAVESYRAIAVWSPWKETRADATYAGGTVAATAGLHRTAQDLLRRFEANYPGDERQDKVQARLGTVYEGLGRPQAAARAYERSLETQPEDAGQRHIRAGDLWLQAERPWLAWSQWEKAAEVSDTQHQAWLRMARARLEAGDHAGADEYYVRMLESGATDEWEELARLGRAICAERKGDYTEALASLEPLEGPKVERARERVERRSGD